VAAGAGLALTAEEITPEAVAQTLKEILTDPSFRASARSIQREIDDTPDAAAVLPDLLERTRP